MVYKVGSVSGVCMSFRYLTKGELCLINKDNVESSGDPYAVENPANLEYALEGTQNKYERLGDDAEKILWKASYLLYQIACQAHAFAEGNKRTALTATLVFLSYNGYYYRPFGYKEQEELVEFVKDVAAGKRTVTAIAKWLGKRIGHVTLENYKQVVQELTKEARLIERKTDYRTKTGPANRRKKTDEKFLLQTQLYRHKLDAVLPVVKVLKDEERQSLRGEKP